MRQALFLALHEHWVLLFLSFWMVLSLACSGFLIGMQQSLQILEWDSAYACGSFPAWRIFSNTLSESSSFFSFPRFSALSFQPTRYQLGSCSLHCTWKLRILSQDCSVHLDLFPNLMDPFVAWCTASCLMLYHVSVYFLFISGRRVYLVSVHQYLTCYSGIICL